MMRSVFKKPSGRISKGAIFLSGSGSNALKLLERLSGPDKGAWEAAALVTDRPETSAARRLAAQFGLADRLVELDIAAFYKERGEAKVSLLSERGREIRAEWTDALRAKLKPFAPDFGILAGFVPLCNIAADFPCLNVHPGDLTCEVNGRRILAGLHTIPIENAILAGHKSLRSSVIIVQPYSGNGSGDMDAGPVLGVSPAMNIDFCGHSQEELAQIHAQRPAQRPPGGFKDVLAEVASRNQDLLKEAGDWVVFPPVARAFAEGRYALDASDSLLWRKADGSWLPVRTVEFGASAEKPMPEA